MATAAPIAAAAVRARKRVLGAFREAHATSPERAIGFTPQRRLERKYFESLLDFGALIPGREGTWWLDEARAAQHSALRRKRAAIMVASVMLLMLLVIGTTLAMLSLRGR
jgi:hypothetical protein